MTSWSDNETRNYKALLGPVVTEKSSIVGSAGNGVIFRVHPSANKADIKKAIEKVFDVKVRCVRTTNVPGKLKRVGKSIGRRSGWKKAYVYLKEGSSIDLLQGL